MFMSAAYKVNGEEKLNLMIVSDAIPVLSASLILAKDKELAKGNLIVGDCVTGKFTSSTGALNLYSDAGTLWNGWKEVPGIDKSKIKEIKVSHGTVYLPPNSSSMFYGCSSLTNLDLSSFDTSKVGNCFTIFSGCTYLEVLRTPKKHTKSGVTLPLTMYDTAGKKYDELPVLSKSIVLTRTTPKPTVSGFSDVQDPSHAYYKAIYWAADAGITKGYPDGTFGINRDCTRGEMMMFLWRLKGKPAPTAVAKAPFPDVPKSHVFYNAVLWGYQKKITTGFTSGPLKGKFGVNENCSRGQIVTFLYRAKSI